MGFFGWCCCDCGENFWSRWPAPAPNADVYLPTLFSPKGQRLLQCALPAPRPNGFAGSNVLFDFDVNPTAGIVASVENDASVGNGGTALEIIRGYDAATGALRWTAPNSVFFNAPGGFSLGPYRYVLNSIRATPTGFIVLSLPVYQSTSDPTKWLPTLEITSIDAATGALVRRAAPYAPSGVVTSSSQPSFSNNQIVAIAADANGTISFAHGGLMQPASLPTWTKPATAFIGGNEVRVGILPPPGNSSFVVSSAVSALEIGPDGTAYVLGRGLSSDGTTDPGAQKILFAISPGGGILWTKAQDFLVPSGCVALCPGGAGTLSAVGSVFNGRSIVQMSAADGSTIFSNGLSPALSFVLECKKGGYPVFASGFDRPRLSFIVWKFWRSKPPSAITVGGSDLVLNAQRMVWSTGRIGAFPPP